MSHGNATHPARVSRAARASCIPHREAVVDGDLRLTYARVLRPLRSLVGGSAGARRPPGRSRRDDRAEHARDARVVLRRAAARRSRSCPLNYRLTADDFAYLIEHSGARVVCAHSDYLDAVDGIRDRAARRGAFRRARRERARAGSTTKPRSRRRRRRVQTAGDRGERSASRSTTRAVRRRAPRA